MKIYARRAGAYARNRYFEGVAADLTCAIELGRAHIKGNPTDARAPREDATSDFSFANDAMFLQYEFASMLLGRAIAYANLDETASALADIMAAIEINDNHHAAHYLWLKVSPDHDTRATIIAHCDQTISAMPVQDPVLYDLRGMCHLQAGMDDLALADFSNAIRIAEHDAAFYRHRSEANCLRRQWARAVVDLTLALQLDPSHADTYRMRGDALLGKGDVDQAVANYCDAILLAPALADAYRNRGFAYYRKRAANLAIIDCTLALNLNPSDGRAHRVRGLAYQSRADRERALTDFAEATRLDPASDLSPGDLEDTAWLRSASDRFPWPW